tara:strand:+ start:901 stop:1683 length:783 start_codon:yes stop_codon:yes gene_type:complete
MRYLILLSALTLFFTSCSNQKETEKYQKQLRESNEALEEIIDYKISSFNIAWAENPRKADHWAKKAHTYFDQCQDIMSKWPLTDSAAINFKSTLEKLQSSDFEKSPCSINPILLQEKSFELFKNHVQINLNCYLGQMLINIGHSDKWLNTYVEPVKMRTGDSILVMLEGNLLSPMPDFVVTFDNPEPIKFNSATSLGYFFLPKNYKDSTISGQVEIVSTKYSQEVEYYPFTIESGYSSKTSPLYFYEPPKKAQRNPLKNP